MNVLLNRANQVVRSLEGYTNMGRIDQVIKAAQMSGIDAIPLEQLKGDLARAGHPVQQALALDPDSRRLFFTDKAGEHLYATFDTSENGHRLLHIGHQASIMKEYDVSDLEGSGDMEVETVHDEDDTDDDPGFFPQPSPGVKPEEDDRGFAKKSNLAARATLLKEALCR